MINGIGAKYNVLTQSAANKNGQSGSPTFNTSQTWNSLSAMSNAFKSHIQDWKSVYSERFADAGANGDGKISQDELSELLQSEFGGKGVRFTEGRVDINNPKAGVFEVYIDEKNRQMMADDPDYRAKMMAVIQGEMAGTKGYSVQMSGSVVNDRTTGLSMNMAEGDPIYEGVPHTAGGTGTATGTMTTTNSANSSGSAKKSKSVMEQLMEKLEKKAEEKREAEKKEAAKKAREDLLEISVEAKAKIAEQAVDKAAEAEEADGEPDEPETTGAAVNVLA